MCNFICRETITARIRTQYSDNRFVKTHIHIYIYIYIFTCRVAVNARRRELYRQKKAQRIERQNTYSASNVAIASEIEAPSTVDDVTPNVPLRLITEAGRYDPATFRVDNNIGTMSKKCPTCNASKFKGESLIMCCRRFRLTCFRQLPEPLSELFRDDAFMKDITAYNAAFSFTS